MSTQDPFTLAREQATGDLQGMMDGGNAPAAVVAENKGPQVPALPALGDDEVDSGDASGEATAVAADPDPSVATPTSAAEGQPETPLTPEVKPINWTLKHRGKEVTISTETELRELAQKGFDYQFKTAELAKEREAESASWAKKEAALRQFLGSKDMVRAYLADLEQLGADSPAPDEAITAAQAQQIADQRVREALTQEREARAKQAYTAQVNQLTDHYRSEVDQAISSALGEHKILAETVEGVEVLLLADIAPVVAARIQADPETPVDLAEVRQLIAASAAKRAGRIVAAQSAAKTQAAIEAARLRKSSPAPAGGGAPRPTAPKAANFKLGSKGLVDAAIADLSGGKGI